MVNLTQHIPVMLSEVLTYLNPQKGHCFVDCTVGIGGHAEAIISKIGTRGHYIAIDRDGDSLAMARERLKDTRVPCSFVHSDFRYVDEILEGFKIHSVDGILLDLGISSYQLDNPARGFSLKADGPLDMRMDRESFICAYDLINSLSEREISAILKNFGQERWHYRIASMLVRERRKNPIASTKDLSDMVIKAVGHRYRKQRIHPATRTFQAIRIAVNRELEALEVTLDKCVSSLKKGGRIGVISFHSLEDKIVKNKFRQLNKEHILHLVVKKPLRPDSQEVNENPRARSARFRVAERIT